MVHANIAEDGTRIALDLDWREVEVAKLIPGYGYSGRTKIHHVPLTWAAMIQLRGLFGPAFTYGEELLAWTVDVKTQRIETARAWRGVVSYEWQESLYPFQNAGLAFMLSAQSGLLGDELGCGKTPQALAFIEATQAFPAIVMCPNSVKYHWEKRVPRWCPSGVPYVLDGSMTKKRKVLAEAKKDPHAVVIVNFESVRGFSRLAPYASIKLKRCKLCDPKFGDDIKPQQCHVHPKELNGFGFKSAIIDEIHRCGDPKTLATRSVWSVAHDLSVQYRWGLTGTPDNMRRLWSIMHTVAPHEYPSRSKFMDRYALMAWNAYGGTDVVGIRPDTRDELFKILDPRFRRMVKEIVLPQLPPIVREIRHCELTPAQRKSYNELETQLYTQLPDGNMLITQNKLVSRTRLSQFAAGTVTVEKIDPDDISTWKVHIGFPSPKIDVMEEVLDELGDVPFVVVCEHVELAHMAAERLADRGIKHQLVAGNVHGSTIEQATEDLKTGALQAIVFTHKKGGVGLDMSGAGTMIKLQRSWSLIEEVQSEGRAHRIGSEKHEVVRIIDIITRDTREEHQVESLHRKFEQLEEITRDRKQIQDQLTKTSPSTTEFSELVLRLNLLNARQEELMRVDDLEELMTHESEGQ